MKQVSQNYRTGEIKLVDTNSPALRPGGVLVQSMYSVISAGTESMKVKQGKMSYLGKARARPDQVKKVLRSIRQEGLMDTYQKVMNKLDSLTSLGYSLSGIVIAIGEGAEAFTVGQRVACAGGDYATHADINFVPKNLVVPVPPNVSMRHAAFATLGSIAMHGYRRAEMQLGETACVIGLGLVGQLLVQILRAAGIRVVGVDLVKRRCELATQLGAVNAVTPDDQDLYPSITRLTGGKGIDCIFITAAGNSNGPVKLAAEIARDRARVVDIGITKLDLPYIEYYEKELEVRLSRSYGPGRYDPNYEEKGIDYPIGYIRWTEQRNMACFLDLLAEERMELDKIISAVYPFEEAEQVYEKMAVGKLDGVGILFKYPEVLRPETRLPDFPTSSKSEVCLDGKIGLGAIGAGNYASSMLLPHLVKQANIRLVEVATATSLSAANAARKFGFERTSTDYKSLIEAPDIDAVIIATRHASHAYMTADALRAGKTVFVEKPLAINLSDLRLVHQAMKESQNRRLTVGFNRRFAPLVKEIAKTFKSKQFPLMLLYRVHAGQLEPGSWYLDPSEGSRFIGEAGHFFDIFSFLTDSRPVSVMASRLHPENLTADDLENIHVTVDYEDGSVGNLLYLTQGGSKVPKEYLEVFGGGCTAQLYNFESVKIFKGNTRRKVKTGRLDKGQKQEVQAFVSFAKSNAKVSIPIESLFDTTLTTLAAVEALRTGQPIRLLDFWDSNS